MNFTLIDKSHYLRGLLILIGKDNKLSDIEKNMFRKLSAELGFSKDFCETAMDEILGNEFIVVDPPKFSNIEIAKLFLIDGMNLASADTEFHFDEASWLNSVAKVNSIEEHWCEGIGKTKTTSHNENFEFEISKFLKN